MTIQQILSITSGVLLSLGGGGAILICLSGWLGKVWAERLMNKERQRHSEELARLRSDLMLRNDEQINKMRNELEIYKEKHLKEHQDKIAIYRIALDMVASMVARIGKNNWGQPLTEDKSQKRIDRPINAVADLTHNCPESRADPSHVIYDSTSAKVWSSRTDLTRHNFFLHLTGGEIL